MFSPSAKAGLGVGDILVTINDWNIEAMDNIQVNKIKNPSPNPITSFKSSQIRIELNLSI